MIVRREIVRMAEIVVDAADVLAAVVVIVDAAGAAVVGWWRRRRARSWWTRRAGRGKALELLVMKGHDESRGPLVRRFGCVITSGFWYRESIGDSGVSTVK